MRVASSCIDMLAGLLPIGIRKTPPGFCADAGCTVTTAVSSPAAIKYPRSPRIIGVALPWGSARGSIRCRGHAVIADHNRKESPEVIRTRLDAARQPAPLPQSREKIRCNAENRPSERP